MFNLLTLLSGISGLALLPLYVLLQQGSLGKGWFVDLATDLIPNLEAVVIIYLIGYFVLFRQGLSREALLEERLDRMTRAPAVEALYDTYTFNFGEALGEAKRVHIIAQYLNTWVGQYVDALTEFFARGGELTAVFADPRADDLSRRIMVQLDRVLFDRTEHRTWVLRGIRDLFTAHKRAGARPEQLKIYIANEMINYFGIVVDDRFAVFLLHDHFASGRLNAPGFRVSLKESPSVAGFVEQEISGFDHLDAKVLVHDYEEAARVVLDVERPQLPPTSQLDRAPAKPAKRARPTA